MLLVLTFSRIFSMMCVPFSSACRRFSSSLSPIFFPRSIVRLCLPLFRFASSPTEAAAAATACCCCSCSLVGMMALREVYSGEAALLSEVAPSWSLSVASSGFLSSSVASG
ncbi:hypothetical protein ZWY2020_023823 [Hordeum vulgare]|nr:hypothetical protein ZWY2020_023823 [Hordeum vulgare]